MVWFASRAFESKRLMSGVPSSGVFSAIGGTSFDLAPLALYSPVLGESPKRGEGEKTQVAIRPVFHRWAFRDRFLVACGLGLRASASQAPAASRSLRECL